jgi:thiosulfate/3-mercaptopyruvate sulfurtransferase
MLTEPEELQKKLNAGGLRILDTRPRPEYVKGHIPGAVWVDVKRWQEVARREGGLRDAEAWGKLVSGLGIGPGSHVVVYGSSLPDTARVWWTLKYLGLPDVAVLDGGWALWVQEKRPTNTAVPAVEEVGFRPHFQADRLEEIGPLRESLRSGKVAVVDARSADEFTGKDVRGKRGGHIPGAKLLEWKDLLTEGGRFRSPEQLRELFRRRGLRPDQTAVTC